MCTTHYGPREVHRGVRTHGKSTDENQENNSAKPEYVKPKNTTLSSSRFSNSNPELPVFFFWFSYNMSHILLPKKNLSQLWTILYCFDHLFGND